MMREVSNTKYFSSQTEGLSLAFFWEVGTPILLSVYCLQAAALCLAVSRNFVDKEFRWMRKEAMLRQRLAMREWTAMELEKERQNSTAMDMGLVCLFKQLVLKLTRGDIELKCCSRWLWILREQFLSALLPPPLHVRPCCRWCRLTIILDSAGWHIF